MKRWNLVCSAILVLGATAAWAVAQDKPRESSEAGLPRTASEAPKPWQYYVEILEPKKGDGDYFDFVVSPEVFDKANETLTDLRLRDARDQEIPYALRVRRTENRQTTILLRQFDPTTAADHTASVSLELQPGRHNAIEITTSGENFRRRVKVESSDDNKEWNPLLERELLFFQAGTQVVDVRKFTYPESRRRYQRVTVRPDPGKKDDRPAILTVHVSETTEMKGENVRLPARVSYREPSRMDNGYSSSYRIDLGKRVPVERLIVEAQENVFDRQYRLEKHTEDERTGLEKWAEPFSVVTRGVWTRTAERGHEPLEIRFNETFAKELRLTVLDANNPPLTLTKVEYEAPVRQVVFLKSAEIQWPVKVYFGNPAAINPNYDFGKTLPNDLDPAPVRLHIAPGEAQRNPDYQAPPVPWSEQHPWLVYAVLGFASVVLLAIMGMLGKQAMARVA
jgi:hypothetical protein